MKEDSHEAGQRANDADENAGEGKDDFGKLQKQAEAIAVSHDRMRARLPLAKQADR